MESGGNGNAIFLEYVQEYVFQRLSLLLKYWWNGDQIMILNIYFEILELEFDHYRFNIYSNVWDLLIFGFIYTID